MDLINDIPSLHPSSLSGHRPPSPRSANHRTNLHNRLRTPPQVTGLSPLAGRPSAMPQPPVRGLLGSVGRQEAKPQPIGSMRPLLLALAAAPIALLQVAPGPTSLQLGRPSPERPCVHLRIAGQMNGKVHAAEAISPTAPDLTVPQPLRYRGLRKGRSPSPDSDRSASWDSGRDRPLNIEHMP